MPAEPTVPWRPESLTALLASGVTPESLVYVLLEEIVDGRAMLAAWVWPQVDTRGRILWPGRDAEPVSHTTIDVATLRAQAYETDQMRRDPRCGDTFAVVRLARSTRQTRDLRRWFTGDVYDISADTHEAARIAYRGGLAAISDEPGREVDALEATTRRDRVPEAPQLTLAPPP